MEQCLQGAVAPVASVAHAWVSPSGFQKELDVGLNEREPEKWQ